MSRKLLLPISGICLLAILSTPLFAQSIISGAVTGTVADPSGADVARAEVTLTNVSTNAVQKTATNAEGSYMFSLVPPGPYRLDVKAPGFQAEERTGFNVTPGQATTLDLKLTVAAASTTVDVVETQAVLQTENADDTTNFSADMIQDLPNPGGDLTYVAQTVSGVVMNTQSGYGNFEANGLPATSNLFTINGGNYNDIFLSINNTGASDLMLGSNDIEEGNIVNNAYSSQYGQYAGTQVSYITKSGTNQFHGDLVYEWNGRAMNANQFFLNGAGQSKPFNNYNQWAANVNGPVRKNKTFFDFDLEGLRNVLPSNASLSLIPSPQFQAATLTNLAAVGNAAEIPFYNKIFAIYNNAPGTKSATPVAGGCEGFTSNLLAASAPCSLEFRASAPNKLSENLWATRVDHIFNDKDRWYGRFWRDTGFQPTFTSPMGPTFNAQSSQPQFAAQTSETHIFGPNTVNQVNLTSYYYSASFVDSNPAAANAALPTFVNFSDESFTGVGANAENQYYVFPNGRRVFQLQLIDDFSHTAGRHSWKAGVSWLHDNVTDLAFQENQTGIVSTDISDFFNGGGPASTLAQNFPTVPEEGYKLNIFGVYVGDDWKVSDRLTVSLNLRLEHYADPTCNAKCFARLATPFNGAPVNDANIPYNQLIVENQSTAYGSVQPIVWEPRIGIAWKPFKDDKTVIRTGIGIFSDPVAGQVAENAAFNLPNLVGFNAAGPGNIAPGVAGSIFTQAAQANQALRSEYNSGGSFNSLSASLPGGFSPPNFTSFPTAFNNPRYGKWNLEVQRALTPKTLLSANYSGMHGDRIPIPIGDVNAYCPASACPSGFAGLPTAVPNPAFGTMINYSSAGVANYNGLQLSVRQRLAAGLSVNVNYTWSHSLDDISNGGQNEFFGVPGLVTDGSLTFAKNPLNLSQQYGNSDYDVKNYFSASIVQNDLIRHLGLKGGPEQLLGGWTVTSNIFWRSGLPFTVVDGSAVGMLAPFNYDTQGAVFASPAGSLSSVNCGNAVTTPCLTTSQFQPSAGTLGYPTGFGTIGRNSLFGPGFFDMDLSLMKSIKIRERANFSFGIQAYNVLNHPNFDQPVNDITSPEFGSTTNEVGPPTSLLGSFVGAGSAPRFVEIKGIVRF